VTPAATAPILGFDGTGAEIVIAVLTVSIDHAHVAFFTADEADIRSAVADALSAVADRFREDSE
jgi:hypothetical protein